MAADGATISGSCHCGAVRWEAPRPTERTRCNCSFCDRVGAEWAYCPPGRFALVAGEGEAASYRFSTLKVEHIHCPTCGCATHELTPGFGEDGRPDPDRRKVGYNLRMAHDFDRSGLPVTNLDGRTY